MERRLTDFGAGTVRAGEENSSSMSVLSSCMASGSVFPFDGSGGDEAWVRALGTLDLRVTGGEPCRAWAAAALALVSWLMVAALVGELLLEVVLRRVARPLRPDCSHESLALRAAWGVQMADSRGGAGRGGEGRGGVGWGSGEAAGSRYRREFNTIQDNTWCLRGMWPSGVVCGVGGGRSTAGATTTRVAGQGRASSHPRASHIQNT